MNEDVTPIEQRAINATKHPAFPVNLIDIRRKIASLLSEVRRYGFFDEYTDHSFSHVQDMMRSMEWVIPDDVRPRLSDAECFMLTISTYFHDLGLLITRNEFNNRNIDIVNKFADEVLFSGDGGDDYKIKVNALEPTAREKFIYQEFVRYHHGTRVRHWIEGKFSSNYGGNDQIVLELESLVGSLSTTLKREIGKLCESHNLDDLNNTDKYKLSHPFGNSEQETANVQYIALILRTCDLLQITKKRAPSVLLRIVDPTDPVSQLEWHKQNAVTNVRRKVMTDQEGRIDQTINSDTIEVFAHFSEAEGFFGLTSFLRYAESQLEQSFRIAEESKKKLGSQYTFPWRKIDEKNIETEGFVPKQFGFELDQEKILTLLTGHTLYNDSTVVIRELTQNAIDAVRLQWQNNSPEENGYVRIKWNSVSGELSITDNGTGMTQDVVERHLLKVGSSRYQDERFIKENPSFNPISRFGIGVLTAFMVANSVEIVTVTPDEQEDARQISLRSVHGKYLIRLLDRESEGALSDIQPHGTSIRLTLRNSAKRSNVLETVRRWIVFPRCRVTVQIDDENPVDIGYKNPEQALKRYLESPDGKITLRNKDYRVVSTQVGPLDIAYVIGKNSFYNDWSLINVGDSLRRSDIKGIPLGTCVEGIAVDFNSPGFNAPTILAVANATGRDAPRTNVARSALEDTEQRSRSISLLYNEYFKQVAAEIDRLAQEPKFSLSWAIGQADYIAAPLTSLKPYRLNAEAYDEALSKTPLFLLETDDARLAVSLADLKKRSNIWIVDSLLIRSVESLVKEAPTNITARSIIDLTHGKGWLPAGDMISGATYSTLAVETIESNFDVVQINANEAERRIDLQLSAKCEAKRWVNENEILRRISKLDARSSAPIVEYFRDRARQRGTYSAVSYPLHDIGVSGLEDFGAVKALGGMFVLPGQGVGELVANLYQSDDEDDLLLCLMSGYLWNRLRIREETAPGLVAAGADKMIKQVESELGITDVNWDSLRVAIDNTNFRYFDPFAWSRRSGNGSIFGDFL